MRSVEINQQYSLLNNMKYDAYVSSLLSEIKCWDGYHKEGMKTSGRTGKRVNNCIKNKKKKKTSK